MKKNEGGTEVQAKILARCENFHPKALTGTTLQKLTSPLTKNILENILCGKRIIFFFFSLQMI